MHNRGSSLIEFAFIMPLLIFIFIIGFEMIQYFRSSTYLHQIANNIAHLLSVKYEIKDKTWEYNFSTDLINEIINQSQYTSLLSNYQYQDLNLSLEIVPNPMNNAKNIYHNKAVFSRYKSFFSDIINYPHAKIILVGKDKTISTFLKNEIICTLISPLRLQVHNPT